MYPTVPVDGFLRVNLNSQLDANSDPYNLVFIDDVESEEPGLANLQWGSDDVELSTMAPQKVTLKYNSGAAPLEITDYSLLTVRFCSCFASHSISHPCSTERLTASLSSLV